MSLFQIQVLRFATWSSPVHETAVFPSIYKNLPCHNEYTLGPHTRRWLCTCTSCSNVWLLLCTFADISADPFRSEGSKGSAMLTASIALVLQKKVFSFFLFFVWFVFSIFRTWKCWCSFPNENEENKTVARRVRKKNEETKQTQQKKSSATTRLIRKKHGKHREQKNHNIAFVKTLSQ